jgi:hypothetical protein
MLDLVCHKQSKGDNINLKPLQNLDTNSKKLDAVENLPRKILSLQSRPTFGVIVAKDHEWHTFKDTLHRLDIPFTLHNQEV